MRLGALFLIYNCEVSRELMHGFGYMRSLRGLMHQL